jgi:TDG/mug DNA glycosylase family protein
MRTLPDLLGPGLELVFVGLNPSEYSAREGHYFANPRNRFWQAFNRSALLPPSLGRECSPTDDAALLEYGIGFTDVVKRPTPQGSGLKAADYRRWAPQLREKLLQCQPRMVCFHGLMAYKAYLRYAEGEKAAPELGLQPHAVGHSEVFVVPNPSPANARYSVEALASWYDEVAAAMRG